MQGAKNMNFATTQRAKQI